MNKLHFTEDMESDQKNSFEAFTKCRCNNILFGSKVKWIYYCKKDFPNIISTIILIIGMVALYLIFIFPAAVNYECKPYAIICIIFGISPVFALLNVTMTEPGVLLKGDLPDPKKNNNPPQNDNNIENQQNNQPQQNSTPIQNIDLEQIEQQQQINQPRIYTERYCSTCKIMRPSKASHCKSCDHCVDGFDHHCFWVGTCIGIRNWRAFNIFLSFATLATLFIEIQCIINIIYQADILYELWILMFKEGSIPVVAFYGLYFICGCWTLQSILNVLILIVMFILPVIYSSVLINISEEYQNYRYYENPYITAVILILFLVHMLFAVSVCCINWHHAAIGKTAKQISSEDEFYIREKQTLPTQSQTLTQIGRNLAYFITFSIPPSRYQQ